MDDFQRWDFWFREIYVQQEVEKPDEHEEENEKGA